MPQLRAFGPLTLDGAAGEVGLGGPKQRAVLAVLLAARGRLVSTDRLVDEVWGQEAPAAARQSVQSYVSNLRRLLDGAATIEAAGAGYVCRPGAGVLDLDRFEYLLAQARAARHAGDPRAVGEAYRAALATAGAPPFEGFEDLPSVMVEATRAESLRMTAVEEHLDVEMERGRGPELVPELESLVARHPLRERLWAHLITGLYQAGRQADALRCYQRARRLLATEMGIEPSPELVELERRILDHDPALGLRRAAPVPAPSTACPYKGLAPYQPEDASLFCGRQGFVDRLVALIGSAHFAAAVGASGSGKSSLLRAGLVPALTGAGGWPVALFTPGADPFTELARRMSPGAGTTTTAQLAAELRRQPGALHGAAIDVLAGFPAGARLLIVVDQLEELFTLCPDPATRTAFAAALAEAAARPDSRVSVALAVRADFYGRCAELAPLVDLLARHHVLVGPMTRAELRAAVVEPATRAGLEVEDGLVDDLLAEAREQPGALPLLSHALLETWLRREGTRLTRAGYADAGGLSGAIARTAKAVLDDQLDPGERATARSVVLDLVHPGADGAPDTGRPVRRRDLRASGPVDAVVEKLTAARLLTRDGDVITLGHEALITSWPDLQAWLVEERDHLVEHRRLAEAAGEWERLGHEPSAVFRGPRLAAAVQLIEGDGEAVTDRERAFVHAGSAQERGAARRRRGVMTGLATLATVATVAATFALVGRGEARREARVATSRRLAAQSALALGRNDRAPALLLAVEALRASATLEARSALGEALVTEVDAAAVLLGHEGDVRSVAVTADGTAAASAGIDGRVRVWDLGRVQERYVFGPFGGEQRDVAFRPDGRAVAAVGIDGVVRTWDVETGAAGHELLMPAAAAPAAPRNTPGGGGGGGGQGAPAGLGPASAEPVSLRAVAWSAEGRIVAASATDGRIHLWDGATGRLQGSFPSGDAEMRDLAFNADGTQLAGSGRDGGIRVWTAAGDPVAVLRGHDDVAFGVAWSRDGSRLASVGRDRTLRLWTVAGARQDQSIVAHDAEIFGVAWAAGGGIATASADRTLRLWDGGTGGRRAELKGHTTDARSVAFDAQGNLVSAANDGTVRLWKASGPGAIRVLGGASDGVFALAFSPDGTLLAGSGREGNVLVWNVDDGSSRAVEGGGAGGEVFGVAFRPDGVELAGGERDGSIRLSDPAGGRSTATLAGGQGPVWSVAYSGDGDRLASAGADGTVLIWDPRRPAAPLLTLRGHERDVFGVALHPSQPVAASVGRDGTLRRWDLERGGSGEVLFRGPSELRSVTFSPDGTLLATAGADGMVRVVSSRTGEEGRVLLGHEGEVRTVSFSPDGRHLATAGRDQNVRYWEAASGRLLASVQVGTGDVRAVAHAPGGRLLAVASNAGAVRLWPTLPDWEAEACAAAGRNLSPAEWDRLVSASDPYRPTCGRPAP